MGNHADLMKERDEAQADFWALLGKHPNAKLAFQRFLLAIDSLQHARNAGAKEDALEPFERDVRQHETVMQTWLASDASTPELARAWQRFFSAQGDVERFQ